ncbi:hypothetical protein PV325_004319 [Microctonus aethiopoides]|nr:hypothetical protein PV325_004319 [Microctonus aethiopoides]
MPPKELQSRKQQKKSIEVNNDKSLSLSAINILDNDCLIKIFSYLPIQDRMRIERVCKRWQTVNQQAWSDIKELTFPLDFPGSSIIISTDERALEKLLLRCGRFLNKLEFKNNDIYCRFDIIPLIAKHCHNLQCLILHLNFNSSPDMTWLFLNLHKIERLKLFRLNRKFLDASLKKLPTNSMKELSLSTDLFGHVRAISCIQITSEGALVIQTMKNLWKLELNRFYFEAYELKLIVCNESITYLSLENCYFDKCINLIANFRGLKYLNLSNVVAVNDDFLTKLAANCTELEELNIQNCRDVTNNDSGAIELLENAPYLEEINLSGTSISTRFLDAAYNVAISRANAIPLKIIVSSTLKIKWDRPQCISESVLIVEGQDEDDIRGPYMNDSEPSDSYNFYDENEIDDDAYDYLGLYDSDSGEVRKAANKRKIVYQGELFNVVPAYKQNQRDTNLKMPPKKSQSRKRQKKSITVNSDQSLSLPTINVLDNDCLIKIFLYLPIKDRMRMERVCKRWQTVNIQAWSDIKELKIPEAIHFLRPFPMKIETTERAVKKLLLRCGRFLNKLEFEANTISPRLNITPIIGEHCRNLQCLILSLNYHSNFNMTSLGLNLHKLERLELSVLKRNNFRDACLKKLSTNTMKELSLEAILPGYHSVTNCTQITRAGAIGIQNMKNLWKLELYGFSFKADKLKLIVCNESITYLSLQSCCFEKCINLIANLRGLTYLNLTSVVAVNNDFLIKLAANCTELEELNIENCRDVSNDGITAVSKLKKLTTLIINELRKVTDTVLSKFVSLKVLFCRNCHLIRDNGVIELLQNAPYLDLIELSGTSISTRFLDAAYNVAISRANAIPLKVFVSFSLEIKWRRPQCISSSVLIVEGQVDDVEYPFDEWARLADFLNFNDDDDDDDEDDYWGWDDSDEDFN